MQLADNISNQLQSAVCSFFDDIQEDARISTVHISLFMALLHISLTDGGTNPVKSNRQRLMKAAKISARQTFNQRINELHMYGYIIYYPGPNQFRPSLIYLKYLEDASTLPFGNTRLPLQ